MDNKNGSFMRMDLAKDDSYVRVELSHSEYKTLIELLKKDEYELKKTIMTNKKIIKKSKKKVLAAKKASQKKSKIAKNKIENAICLLRLECSNCTRYGLAKRAGVAHKTVTDMISEEKMRAINESIRVIPLKSKNHQTRDLK